MLLLLFAWIKQKKIILLDINIYFLVVYFLSQNKLSSSLFISSLSICFFFFFFIFFFVYLSNLTTIDNKIQIENDEPCYELHYLQLYRWFKKSLHFFFFLTKILTWVCDEAARRRYSFYLVMF